MVIEVESKEVKRDLLKEILSDAIARTETDSRAWDQAIEFGLSQHESDDISELAEMRDILQDSMYGFIQGFIQAS